MKEQYRQIVLVLVLLYEGKENNVNKMSGYIFVSQSVYVAPISRSDSHSSDQWESRKIERQKIVQIPHKNATMRHLKHLRFLWIHTLSK